MISPTWKVGFGGGSAEGAWDIMANSTTARVIRGPLDQNGNRVDLAFLAVRYSDVTPFQPIALAAPTVGGAVILAGYGHRASLDNINVRYDIVPDYGAFRSGPNRIDDQGLLNGVSVVDGIGYHFVGTKSDLDITGPGGIPLFVGEGYVLNGDSGGPTLASDGKGGFALVGIHHSSQTWSTPGNP